MGEKSLRILLVDDDKIDQKAVARFIKKQHLPYQLDVAGSLASARGKLEQQCFDLILLDYLLPDGTGLELLPETEIPAIILTGGGSELVAAEAMRKGAYDYLAKDSERNYLLLMPQAVERALERKKNDERIRQLERITNTSSDMLAVLDSQFTYLAANPAYLAAFNKSYDEVIGHTASELFGKPFFYEVIRPHALRCLAGEEVNYQRWFDFPAYDPRYMDVHYYPYRKASGEVAGYVVNERDITKHERTEELLLQEAIFRKSIIDRAAEGLCVCHEVAQFPFVEFTLWNERMAEITGYTMDQINRKGWYQSLYPDPEYRQKAIARMDAMLQGKDLLSEEWEITRADGQKRTVLISTSLIMKENGDVDVLALIADITEYRKAEKTVHQIKGELEKFFALVPDLVCVAGTDGYFKRLNPEWEKVLGHTVDEMLARPFTDFIHPDDVQPTFEEVEKQLAGQRTFEFINRYRHKDGTYRWLEWVATPAENGTVLYAAARDITRRRQAEGALALSEEKFRSLTEQSPNMIFINQAGRVVFANAQCEEALGYSREELLAADFDFRRLIAPEHLDLINGYFAMHMNGEDVPPYECALIAKSGKRLDTIHATRLISYGGNQVILGVVTDITERKLAENTYKMLVESMGKKIGEELFDAVTNALCDWADLDCAIVGELTDGGRVQALGMHMGGEAVHDFSYDLAGTPCENVTEQGLCEYPEGIVQLFPEDKILEEMGAEGYIGTPLRDRAGKVVGILCALSRHKLDLPPNIREVLQIVASRVAAEIERLKAEKRLEAKLDEIERMNRLMVGRELKMEELRRENKRLREDVAEFRKAVEKP